MKGYVPRYDKNGDFLLDERYTEILKLDKMLTEADIPHTLSRWLDGWIVIYTVDGKKVGDAVEHFGSYGHEENLLETIGLTLPKDDTSDSVLGWLTAADVFKMMRDHYQAHKSRNEDKTDGRK